MIAHGPVGERFMRHYYGAAVSETRPQISDERRRNIVAVLDAVDELLATGGYASDSSARHQLSIARSMLADTSSKT